MRFSRKPNNPFLAFNGTKIPHKSHEIANANEAVLFKSLFSNLKQENRISENLSPSKPGQRESSNMDNYVKLSSANSTNSKVVIVGLCYCLQDSYLLHNTTKLNDSFVLSESTEIAKIKKPKGFWKKMISFFDFS